MELLTWFITHPLISIPAVTAIPGAVFSPVAQRLEALAGEVCPLHVGDTWLEPFVGGRMQDLASADLPGLNRYSPPQGIPELIDAIVEKVRGRNEMACERDSVLVCAGATSALSCATGMLEVRCLVIASCEANSKVARISARIPFTA